MYQRFEPQAWNFCTELLWITQLLRVKPYSLCDRQSGKVYEHTSKPLGPDLLFNWYEEFTSNPTWLWAGNTQVLNTNMIYCFTNDLKLCSYMIIWATDHRSEQKAQQWYLSNSSDMVLPRKTRINVYLVCLVRPTPHAALQRRQAGFAGRRLDVLALFLSFNWLR